MKGRSIILDHLENREAAALIVDGVLEDFLIEGDAPTPGTIYRARADRPVKGQGGMFLTTPDGPAFLRQVLSDFVGVHAHDDVTRWMRPPAECMSPAMLGATCRIISKTGCITAE